MFNLKIFKIMTFRYENLQTILSNSFDKSPCDLLFPKFRNNFILKFKTDEDSFSTISFTLLLSNL